MEQKKIENRIEQNRTEQNRTQQNRREQKGISPLHPAPTMSKGSCGTCASRWVARSDAAPVRLAVAVRP